MRKSAKFFGKKKSNGIFILNNNKQLQARRVTELNYKRYNLGNNSKHFNDKKQEQWVQEIFVTKMSML